MDQERRFVAALEATRAYRHEGDALLLLDEAGRIRVRLIRQAAESASPSRLAAHVFRCAEGPTFVLRPKGAEAADLVLGADVRRLAREPAASGTKYADDDLFVWNKGSEAILGVRNREYRCAEDRLASIREDARARGVEFRATGNEPGWLLEVQPDRIVFAGAGGEQAIVPRPAPAVDPAQGATTYAAATEAHRLRVRIEDGACADTMSGEQFGARVTVDLDGREYRGCGSALR
jgi:putative lipoprotein